MKYTASKTTFLFVLFAFTLIISACKSSNSKIKNNIEIKENGLHIEEAYLTNNNQSLIGDDNKVKVGERVYIRLVVTGWTIKNGKVFLDASQKTSTSDGQTLAFNPSILGHVYSAGTDVNTAKYISLYQNIGKLDKHYNYILISFKIWDKISNKSVSGSCKLHVDVP
jgi:hypothetical protein